jgi:hypothetical protein
MSVIVKAGSDICKANTNTSTAKYQYTIPKAARFAEPRVIPKGGTYHFYKLPSTLSKRYTKFGYGTKSDFTKGDKNYVPKIYNTGTDFDPKNPHGPKYSFPNARDKYGKVYLESIKPFDKFVPGPAKYSYLKPFGSDAPKVSFKGKYDNVETRKKKLEEEEEKEKEKQNEGKKKEFSTITIQIRSTGKYSVSQIPNVNSMRFDKDKSKRTKFIANNNPGPGTYESKQLMGRIFPSQYRSHEPISFAQKHKVKDSRSNYPGPGSYILPSDFGIYQSKDADKYPKENVYVEEKKKDEDHKPWRHGMKKIKPKPETEENEENYDNNDYGSGDQDNQEQENKEEEQPHENEEEKKEEETKKEEEKKEEEKKEEETKKDEDKESECVLLRDILQYQDNA